MVNSNLYSVLRASTGSFLLAILAGISPAITVSKILITTNIIPPVIGNLAIDETPERLLIMMFIGIFKIMVTSIPSNPAAAPIIKILEDTYKVEIKEKNKGFYVFCCKI